HLARLSIFILFIPRHESLLELEAASLGHCLHLLGERFQSFHGIGTGRGIIHVGPVLEKPCGLPEFTLVHRGRLPGRGYRDASCRLVTKVNRCCDVHLHLG
ncbi:MAG: hypothetical protein ACK56I_24520, partial [bacterium]